MKKETLDGVDPAELVRDRSEVLRMFRTISELHARGEYLKGVKLQYAPKARGKKRMDAFFAGQACWPMALCYWQCPIDMAKQIIHGTAGEIMPQEFTCYRNEDSLLGYLSLSSDVIARYSTDESPLRDHYAVSLLLIRDGMSHAELAEKIPARVFVENDDGVLFEHMVDLLEDEANKVDEFFLELQYALELGRFDLLMKLLVMCQEIYPKMIAELDGQAAPELVRVIKALLYFLERVDYHLEGLMGEKPIDAPLFTYHFDFLFQAISVDDSFFWPSTIGHYFRPLFFELRRQAGLIPEPLLLHYYSHFKYDFCPNTHALATMRERGIQQVDWLSTMPQIPEEISEKIRNL